MLTLYIIGLGVIALFCGFPLLMIAVAMIEKQYLKQELTPVAGESSLQVLPYFTATNELAEQNNFIHCGDFYPSKGKSVVKGNLSAWLSPDKHTLCLVVTGKFAGMRTRKTRLITRLRDGSFLETADEAGTVDITGATQLVILLYADLTALNALHESRLASCSEGSQLFADKNILTQMEEMEMARGERLVDFGLARFADWDRETIRYTLKGAWKLMLKSRFGARPELKKQTHRVELKRPGDPGYRVNRITPPALPPRN
jgi:hypothetical protein